MPAAIPSRYVGKLVPVYQATGQPAESYARDSRTSLGVATNRHMLDSAKAIIISLYDAAVTAPIR